MLANGIRTMLPKANIMFLFSVATFLFIELGEAGLAQMPSSDSNNGDQLRLTVDAGGKSIPFGTFDPVQGTAKVLQPFIDGVPIGETTPASAAVTTLKGSGRETFSISGPITTDGGQQYGGRTDVTNTGASTGYGDRFACLTNASDKGFEICRSSLMFDLSTTPAGTGYQSMWIVHVSPNDNTHAWTAVDAEVNMTNRGDDKGYSNLATASRFVGGMWFVPESQAFGQIGHARNVDFGWGVARSGGRNDLGKYVKTYNGFIVYPDSIGANGRAFEAQGATDGLTADFPYSPLEIRNSWQTGINCDGASFIDFTCLRLSASQGIRFGSFLIQESQQITSGGLLLQENGGANDTITLQNNTAGAKGENAVSFLEPNHPDGTIGCERGALGYGSLKPTADRFTKKMFIEIGDICTSGDKNGTSVAILNSHIIGAGLQSLSGKTFTQFLAAEDGHFEWHDYDDNVIMSLNPTDKTLGASNVVAASITVSGISILPFKTPTSSTSPCTQGQVEDDANYHYVCVAWNTWKRAALTSF